MCDGCTLDEDSLGEVLPGNWELIHARGDTFLMKTDQWGLMYGSALICKWNATPILDPFEDMKPSEIKKLSKSAYMKMIRKYENALGNFANSMKIAPTYGYRLIQAVKAAGWRERREGFERWLFSRIATFILEQQATPEWKQKVGIPGYVLTDTDVDILKVIQKKNRNTKC